MNCSNLITFRRLLSFGANCDGYFRSIITKISESSSNDTKEPEDRCQNRIYFKHRRTEKPLRKSVNDRSCFQSRFSDFDVNVLKKDEGSSFKTVLSSSDARKCMENQIKSQLGVMDITNEAENATLIFSDKHGNGDVSYKQSNSTNERSQYTLLSPSTEGASNFEFSDLVNFDKNVELSEETKAEIETYIDTMRPYSRPISFDIAYFVNDSSALKEFVKMGVDVYRWNQPRRKAEYAIKLDFDRDCKNTILFLCDLGLNGEEVAKLITVNPFIFEEEIANLNSRVEYLKSKQFSEEDVVKIVSKAPFWLSTSITKIENGLGWLRSFFNLADDEIRNLVPRKPKLITFDRKFLKSTVFKLKEYLSFSDDQIKHIVFMSPKVLFAPYDIIERNFHFLFNEMNFDHEKILEYSNILITKLAVIKPRILYMKQLGAQFVNADLPNFVSLRSLCLPHDAMFCETVAKTSLENYKQFLKTL